MHVITDFKKFCAIMTRIHLNEQICDGLRKLFQVFDVNNDGLIEPKEICQIMNELGEQLTEQQVNIIIISIND